MSNSKMHNAYKVECCPVPNVMAALPNIGGALCSTPESLAQYWVPCSNAAKTRNPWKFAGCPASGPKFTILWKHVEDIARQSCAMVPRW